LHLLNVIGLVFIILRWLADFRKYVHPCSTPQYNPRTDECKIWVLLNHNFGWNRWTRQYATWRKSRTVLLSGVSTVNIRRPDGCCVSFKHWTSCYFSWSAGEQLEVTWRFHSIKAQNIVTRAHTHIEELFNHDGICTYRTFQCSKNQIYKQRLFP
jgi:hypothetical protein